MLENLELLDKSWRTGKPVLLSNMIAAGIDGAQFAELAAADLEWRWRTGQHPPKSPEEYLREFPLLSESEQWFLELVEAEFVARSRWAQPPRIEHYVARFQGLSHVLKDRLLERLNDVSLLVIAVSNPPEVNGRFVLKSPLVVGRLRAGCGEALGISGDGHRLVITDKAEIGLSREHCKIERVRRSLVNITNWSRRGEMRVSNRYVGPGDSVEHIVPVTVEVADIKLVLEEL